MNGNSLSLINKTIIKSLALVRFVELISTLEVKRQRKAIFMVGGFSLKKFLIGLSIKVCDGKS